MDDVAASGPQRKYSALEIVEISDEEDDQIAERPDVAPKKYKNSPENSHTELVPPSPASDNNAFISNPKQEGESVIEEDEAQYSESESFINDLMNSEDDLEEDFLQDADQLELCTPEESQYYRQRLHEIGVAEFVEETITTGIITAKKLLTAFGKRPPPFWDGSHDSRYYRFLGMILVEEFLKRKKLPQYNTIDDVVDLIKTSKNIMVITGAGISTNLGIPDFRSKDTGFYAKMQAKGFSSGEEVFDIHLFNEDPSYFYDNCGETFPVAGVTTPTHQFIGLIQDKGKLLTNYTQNIDNIEASAGILPEKLLQCHGSWATATCRKCEYKCAGQAILPEVKQGTIPTCPECKRNIEAEMLNRHRESRIKDSNGIYGPNKRKRSSLHISANKAPKLKPWEESSSDSDSDFPSDNPYAHSKHTIPTPGVMKPDITFFGESLPSTFFKRFNEHDKPLVDLVLVIGTSMKVAPVSEIPMALRKDVPCVYISRDLCRHIEFDINLLGDCDVITCELAKRVGWDLPDAKGVRKDALEELKIEEVDKEKAIWSITKREDQKS